MSFKSFQKYPFTLEISPKFRLSFALARLCKRNRAPFFNNVFCWKTKGNLEPFFAGSALNWPDNFGNIFLKMFIFEKKCRNLNHNKTSNSPAKVFVQLFSKVSLVLTITSLNGVSKHGWVSRPANTRLMVDTLLLIFICSINPGPYCDSIKSLKVFIPVIVSISTFPKYLSPSYTYLL